MHHVTKETRMNFGHDYRYSGSIAPIYPAPLPYGEAPTFLPHMFCGALSSIGLGLFALLS